MLVRTYVSNNIEHFSCKDGYSVSGHHTHTEEFKEELAWTTGKQVLVIMLFYTVIPLSNQRIKVF